MQERTVARREIRFSATNGTRGLAQYALVPVLVHRVAQMLQMLVKHQSRQPEVPWFTRHSSEEHRGGHPDSLQRPDGQQGGRGGSER